MTKVIKVKSGSKFSVLGENFQGIDPACTLTCSLLASDAFKMEMDATGIVAPREMRLNTSMFRAESKRRPCIA